MHYYVAVDTEMNVPDLYGPFETHKDAQNFASGFHYDTEIIVSEHKLSDRVDVVTSIREQQRKVNDV